MGFLSRIFKDLRLYFLLVPFVFALVFVDKVLAVTWLQLLIMVPILLGFALFLRKLMFHTDFSAITDEAVNNKNIAAALIVFSYVIFMSVIFIGSILWLKG